MAASVLELLLHHGAAERKRAGANVIPGRDVRARVDHHPAQIVIRAEPAGTHQRVAGREVRGEEGSWARRRGRRTAPPGAERGERRASQGTSTRMRWLWVSAM